MKFVVGLWAVETSGEVFTAATMDARIIELGHALTHFDTLVAAANLPHSQLIKGIFLAPEYFLAHQYADYIDTTLISPQRIERTISIGDRDRCVQQIRTLSAAHPNVLIIPGSIAWKKTFTRQAGEDMARDPRTQERTAVPKVAPGDRRTRAVGHLNHFINLDAKYARIKSDSEWIKDRTRPGIDKARYKGRWHVPSNEAKRDMASGNTDIVLRDGKGGTVTKTLPAVVEYYMRNTAYVYFNNEIIYKYHKRGDFFEAINTYEQVFIPSRKEPITDISVTATKQMKFGFEICLDHNIEMLKTFIRKDGLGEPDFHIICSAAVKNNTANMCMRDGGFLLHASSETDYTVVYENDRGIRREVAPDAVATVRGHTFKSWTIDVLDPIDLTYLRKVVVALDRYNREKTIAASKASKNALAVLRRLADAKDVAALRQHIAWYLGKSGAAQPLNAGDRVPANKRFYTLLDAV